MSHNMTLKYDGDEDRAVAHGLSFSFIALSGAETGCLPVMLEVLGINLYNFGFKTACHLI